MTDDARSNDIDCRITALTESVGALATTVAQLSERVEYLQRRQVARLGDASGGFRYPIAMVVERKTPSEKICVVISEQAIVPFGGTTPKSPSSRLSLYQHVAHREDWNDRSKM